MAREEYQTALETLRTDVCAFGDSVVALLEAGLASVERADPALAGAVADGGGSVVEGDGPVGERSIALESDCLDLLALQQPVAGDLRFVASTFKILTDLERIAALAANMGEYAIAIEPTALGDVDTLGIGALATDFVERALDAYRREDADAARDVVAADDDLDARCLRASGSVVRDLVARESDDVTGLLLAIRDLERVGDHAANVAARTVYAVENDAELLR